MLIKCLSFSSGYDATNWIIITTTDATINVIKINSFNDSTGSIEFDFTFKKNGDSHDSSGIISEFKIS